MAALAGGCAMELRAVCRPMEVCGAAAVMAEAKATHGESAMSSADVEASAARWRHAASTVATDVGAAGRVRGSGDRR